MEILVTGGCGFIGSHLVDAYIEQGHDVTIIDDLSTGTIDNLNEKATLIEKDIADPDLHAVLGNHTFEVINHHAAQINVRTSVNDPILDARTNIIGALNVLYYGIHHGMTRFIFASSGGTVYGEPCEFPITEDFPIAPTSPYGIAKATFERYLMVFAQLYHFSPVILRYANVYGPRQISKSEAGVISIFIENILSHNTCIIYGDGKQTRDYVYVADVVNANMRALTSDAVTVNIGTGIETSVNDLVGILSDITGQQIGYEHGQARAGEVFRNVVSPQKAAQFLDWKPVTTLNKGIARTFEYFQHNSAHAK
jgi:UDP-glucose 4-epimerase